MSKCKAIIEFGDDFGDNSSTFHCQLEEGHKGLHSEKGIMRGYMPYTLTWDGDIPRVRIKCPVCGRTEEIETEEWEYLQSEERKNDYGKYTCGRTEKCASIEMVIDK